MELRPNLQAICLGWRYWLGFSEGVVIKLRHPSTPSSSHKPGGRSLRMTWLVSLFGGRDNDSA